jgi:hypothetical protein
VPVEEPPPIKLAGFKLKLAMVAGVIVRVAATVVALKEAKILAVVWDVTPKVATLNVADNCPLGTVTDNGMEALVLAHVRLTTVPPVAAGPVRVTVPIEEIPPGTVVGLTVIVANDIGLIVSGADREVPFKVPEMSAVVTELTPSVETLNVVEL